MLTKVDSEKVYTGIAFEKCWAKVTNTYVVNIEQFIAIL